MTSGLADRETMDLHRNISRPRVVIAEDQKLLRDCLIQICPVDFQCDVVGTVETGQALLGLCTGNCPDVAIIDLNLPDIDGIDLASKLRSVCPEAKTLIYSSDCSTATVLRVSASKDVVHGFVSKAEPLGDLGTAIKSVLSGFHYFCPTFRARQRSIHSNHRAWPKILSDKELEVLPLLAAGIDVEAISAKMGAQTGTIAAHRKNILRKLDLTTVSELVHFAIAQGFIQTTSTGETRQLKLK